jgi:hypothetical protein
VDGNVLAATPLGRLGSDDPGGQAILIPDGTAAIVVNTGRRIRGRISDGPSTMPD